MLNFQWHCYQLSFISSSSSSNITSSLNKLSSFLFWILGDMFNMSVNILNCIFKIDSEAISLLPIMRNLLLIYSFLRLASSLCLKLHGFWKYLTTLQRKDESSKKRRNTVSFAEDQLGHNANQCIENLKETKDVVSNEKNKSTFKNTRDYWNQMVIKEHARISWRRQKAWIT